MNRSAAAAAWIHLFLQVIVIQMKDITVAGVCLEHFSCDFGDFKGAVKVHI